MFIEFCFFYCGFDFGVLVLGEAGRPSLYWISSWVGGKRGTSVLFRVGLCGVFFCLGKFGFILVKGKAFRMS